MSGGRVELGLGTGWFDAEHTAYGIPFPPLAERFDRLEEQLEIITGLWETPEGETFSFDGTHYTLTDSPALPKPAQRPRPPILVGGDGPRRTPRLAAQVRRRVQRPVRQPGGRPAPRSGGSARPARRRAVIRGRWCIRPRRRCAAAGTTPRWPGGPQRSASTVAELRRPAWPGRPPRSWTGSAGSRDARASARVYLQVLDLHDLDHLELIASEVMPHVR